MNQNSSRELFATRAGFILMTAGCAVGLGNVWRFSYITGQYGGGFFVLLYLFFLLVLGLPVMLMELAIGRAGRSTFPGAFRKLQSPQSRFAWQRPAYLLFSGNLILLMFYSVITGWLLVYSCGFLTGKFNDVTTEKCGIIFNDLLSRPLLQSVAMAVGVVLTVLVCYGGIRKTVEKVIKIMMGGLFLLLIVLVIQALSLKNSGAGVRFFLMPDFSNFMSEGLLSTVHAAMAQAFFTLSLGIGSIAVCGSYTSGEDSLLREGCWIIVLDTLVAVSSGLIIFPACAAFNIQPDAGPSLVFITLPNVFTNMPLGNMWGFLFFVFLSIAALSTLIAVFENLVAFGMDEWNWSRHRSCLIFGVILLLLSMPCILGFNLWKDIQPLGANSNILDLEDFIVSNNLLPLGALFMTIFCMNRYGWSENGFFKELNRKKCVIPNKAVMFYLRWILPLIILLIWLIGWQQKFFPDLLK